MASGAPRICFAAFRSVHRKVPRRRPYFRSPTPCFYHTSPPTHASPDREGPTTEPPAGSERQPFEFRVEDLGREERIAYESLSTEDQANARKEMAEFHEHMTQPAFTSEMNAEVALAAKEMQDAAPYTPLPPRLPMSKLGFLARDEEEPDDIGEDPPFEGDDMTSMAHGDLEQHREMRQYARMIVWDLPLLYKHSKPFVPPTADQPLRFRQTTYLGLNHPGSKKMVCEFCTQDVAAAAKLTEAQRIKLIKLVGVRYNPDTDIVKMSSEMHETAMQNKRYLLDLIDNLIKEAKDDTDTFEDLPLDFRHHKSKKVWKFPQEWKLDGEKRRQLLAEREKAKTLEEAKAIKQELVEGKTILDQAIAAMPKDVPRIVAEPRQRQRLR